MIFNLFVGFGGVLAVLAIIATRRLAARVDAQHAKSNTMLSSKSSR